MGMVVIVLENAPPRIRGRLSLWNIEVRAGVYVGNHSSRVRAAMWREVLSNIEDGSAVLAWACPTESGYDFWTVGPNRRMAVDHDGLRLVRFRPLPKAHIALEEGRDVPWGWADPPADCPDDDDDE